MRPAFMASLGLAVALMGCGSGGPAADTGPGATAPAGNGAGSFCDAAGRLELADASNRRQIQAGLESVIPAGQERNVAVVREFMERQASGDDPYKDPEFLDDYDDAVHDIWEHCGIG